MGKNKDTNNEENLNIDQYAVLLERQLHLLNLMTQMYLNSNTLTMETPWMYSAHNIQHTSKEKTAIIKLNFVLSQANQIIISHDAQKY